MNYSLKPTVNELLDSIKSRGPLLMDMSVQKIRRKPRWSRWWR
jgi:hypothetical protein